MKLEKLSLASPFYELGPDFYDAVKPGNFHGLQLRWYNPEVFYRLGLDPEDIEEGELLQAFGVFAPLPQGLHPPLAQRYIGYQFQVFNPNLGDGRGFLLAQVRSRDGKILDLGTKGSGTTPYSRGGDGQLTLKGGVRELIAAEFLHAMGVKTSRPLLLIEHDARLWRNDEPSPTRASILVRVGESHIRFGSFERLYHFIREPERKKALLGRFADHVIEHYYPELLRLPQGEERYVALYSEVVGRTAALCAAWVRAGFCHGVLNTDNMNITGDSFDYGPYAFMDHYDPEFTAAYFDQEGLYAFERQPDACYWNLAMLVYPFSVIAPEDDLLKERDRFPGRYREALRKALLPRLGFVDKESTVCKDLLAATLKVLRGSGMSYHGFFRALSEDISSRGLREDGPVIPSLVCPMQTGEIRELAEVWRLAWQTRLAEEPGEDPAGTILRRLKENNPVVVPYRPEIEKVWEAIDQRDDWNPLYNFLKKLQNPFAL